MDSRLLERQKDGIEAQNSPELLRGGEMILKMLRVSTKGGKRLLSMGSGRTPQTSPQPLPLPETPILLAVAALTVLLGVVAVVVEKDRSCSSRMEERRTVASHKTSW